MSYDRETLRQELIRDEGLLLGVYHDSLGNATIGVGHLVRPSEHFTRLTRQQAITLLDQDINEAEKTLSHIVSDWRTLDEVRQRALLNLAFNLGYRLAQFRHFLQAVRQRDWPQAANQLTDSVWFTQVRSRGPRIVQMIRDGKV